MSLPSENNFLTNRRFVGWSIVAACAILISLLLAWNGIKQYNEIQQMSDRVDTDLDQVVNQYMRRADLIPKLNHAVDSYSSHEKELVYSINRAQVLVDKVKSGAYPSTSTEQMNDFIRIQKEIDLAIGQFQMSFRNNRGTSAADLYMGLMVQIEGTENRISFARSNYIESINTYNLGLKKFPMRLFATKIGFEPKTNYFKDYVAILKTPN